VTASSHDGAVVVVVVPPSAEQAREHLKNSTAARAALSNRRQ